MTVLQELADMVVVRLALVRIMPPWKSLVDVNSRTLGLLPTAELLLSWSSLLATHRRLGVPIYFE